MPGTVSNSIGGAIPVVSNDAQKGSRYHSLVCVQQVARLRNVAGPDPEGTNTWRNYLKFTRLGMPPAPWSPPRDSV